MKMNSTPKPENHSYFICPECRTVNHATVSSCSLCDLSFDWITNHEGFQNALTMTLSSDIEKIGPWSLHFHLLINMPGEELTFSEPITQVHTAFSIILSKSDSPQFSLSKNLQSIDITSNQSTITLNLPGSISAEGYEVTCWYTADFNASGTPPEIRMPDMQAPFPLRSDKEICFGRNDTNDVQLFENHIASQHSIFVWRPETNEYWVTDVGTDHGTYINRKRISSAKLSAGDLVRIGPFAWTFNSEAGNLIPVSPINQIEIQVNGLQVDHKEPFSIDNLKKITNSLIKKESKLPPSRLRINVPECKINSEQFVAIIGPSGSGKSTLLKALAGLSDSRDRGKILVNEKDIDTERAWFCDLLGYVPQQQTVHPSLSARNSLEYSANLRGKNRGTNSDHVERILYQVQLPDSRWDASIKNLSGGEIKRVCTAIELIADPQLLLLDEPGSGLDQEREHNLMKLLRNLCLRGCTVVVVTHNLDLVHLCDRLLVINRGEICYDGPPSQFLHYDDMANLPRHESPATNNHQPDSFQSTIKSFFSNISNQFSLNKSRWSFAENAPKGWKQFKLLIKRETEIIHRDIFSRLLLPLIIMPAIFAFSLGFAVEQTNLALLWFFAILASIWMGTSLSLLSIVGEREIFDHENHLFLRVTPYLMSKGVVLGSISAIQTVLFVLMLWMFRWFAGGEFLSLPNDSGQGNNWSDLPWILFSLCLVSWAAVSSGMLISAISNQSRTTANMLLPLFMIAQIVFSVPICTGTSEDSLNKSYGIFHGYYCANSSVCERRASNWNGAINNWLCSRCNHLHHQLYSQKNMRSQTNISNNVQLEKLSNELQKQLKQMDPKEIESLDEAKNEGLPNRTAAQLSSLMLSRYGDIALRSFAFDSLSDEEQKENLGWFWSAVWTLFLFIIFQLLITVSILFWQSQKNYLLTS